MKSINSLSHEEMLSGIFMLEKFLFFIISSKSYSRIKVWHPPIARNKVLLHNNENSLKSSEFCSLTDFSSLST